MRSVRVGAAPDADVAGQLAVPALLHTEVDQRVLPKHALGVQVGGQEAAGAQQGARGRQALHVGGGHDVVQELVHVRDGGVDGDLQTSLSCSSCRCKERLDPGANVLTGQAAIIPGTRISRP